MKKTVISLLTAVTLTLTAMPLLASEPVKTTSPSQTAASVATLININTAPAAELEKLPGIGKKSAAAIVAYRTEKGKFKNTRDLLKVNGVGEKTLAKIKNLISFE